jgi:sugar lactone lactonase YvrE
VPHVISGLRPGWAVPGAPVAIEGVHLPVPTGGPPHVLVGSSDAHVLSASHRALRIVVPVEGETGTVAVRIDELPGETIYLEVARPFATGVHQVDSPAFGIDRRLYCTMSGGRDSKAAVPLFRIYPDGAREPIAVEIANPTSLAVGPDGLLYISSRFDGTVHRLLGDDRAELFATGLGTATGLAFDAQGHLFVGDRAGSILRVSPDRQVETFATIPASVAAFHLTMGPDGCLYVAAPTLATHDAIYRVTPDRLVDVVYNGFGRPQGLAFDTAGLLYVVEALAGASGLYRIDVGAPGPETRGTPGLKPLGSAELILAAASLVGVCFDPDGGLLVASADTVWRLDCPLQPLIHGQIPTRRPARS